MDRGVKSYEPTGETTEWEDILIKKGILAPKTKVVQEDEQAEEDQLTPEQAQAQARENATLEELDEMEDEYDDDIELQRIRERRIAEMKAQAARNIFGSIQPISKDEWTREVTDASKQNWVVAFLWEENVLECKVVEHSLREIAGRHRDVKFVSIRSVACIENWPARNVPTLFLYHEGELKNQMLSNRKLGGINMKTEALEEFLATSGVFGRSN